MKSNATSNIPVSEESYFVSLSDLMIGLLFVFIIILMAFAIKYRSAEDQIVNNDAIRRELLKDIKETLDDRGVTVQVDYQNGVLHLPESLLFASGSASLSNSGKKNIKTLAATLMEILPCYSESDLVKRKNCKSQTKGKLEAVFIEGHTDKVPIHNAKYRDNWDLSAERSVYTYRTLTGDEPALDTLLNSARQPLLSVSAYEARRPRVLDPQTDQERRLNRRIDLRFLMTTPKAVDMRRPETSSDVKEVLGGHP